MPQSNTLLKTVSHSCSKWTELHPEQKKNTCPSSYLAPTTWSHRELQGITEETCIHEVTIKESRTDSKRVSNTSPACLQKVTPHNPNITNWWASLPLLLHLLALLRPETAGGRLPLGIRRKKGKMQKTMLVAWRCTRKDNPLWKRPAEHQKEE